MSAKTALVTSATELPVKEVINRIEKILTEKGIKIFARISHSDAAHQAGLTMQDEELIIFGNPKAGTPLMLEAPGIGIELPLKIIAWRDHQKTLVGIQNVDRLISDYPVTKSANTIKLFKSFMLDVVESALKHKAD